MSKAKFTTIGAATRLMKSMEIAIDNMIDEIKTCRSRNKRERKKSRAAIYKANRNRLQRTLIERQRLEQMIKDLKSDGEIGEAKDYSGGFAERFSK